MFVKEANVIKKYFSRCIKKNYYLTYFCTTNYSNVMKKFLFSTLGVFFTLSCIAQSYDYSKYLFPDVKYKTLIVGADANYINPEQARQFNSSRTIFNNSDNISFSNFNFSRKKNVYDYASLAFRFNTYENSKNESKNNIYVNPSLQLTRNATYYNSKNQYISYLVDLDNYYYAEKIYDQASTKSLSTYLKTSIGIGKGRLENVSVLVNAQNLMKDLQEENPAFQSLTENELFSLANKISQSSYRRIFDQRKYSKALIKSIHEWFEENGKSNTLEQISLSTTIMDYLLLTPYFYRTNGKVKEISLENFAYHNNSSLYTDYTTTQHAIRVKYQNNKAINLKRQNNFSTELKYIFNKDWDNSDVNRNLSGPYLISNYTWAYYPDSRNYMSLSPSIQYSYATQNKNHFIRPAVSFDYNRLFQFRTSFNIGLELYQNFKSDTQDEILRNSNLYYLAGTNLKKTYVNFNIGFRHNIF